MRKDYVGKVKSGHRQSTENIVFQNGKHPQGQGLPSAMLIREEVREGGNLESES